MERAALSTCGLEAQEPTCDDSAMSGLAVERFWPYALSIVIMALWYFVLHAPFPAAADALMGASGTVAAVLIGFMGTSKAIILGLANTPIFKQLKAAGYMDRFFSYLYESILVSFALLILSIVGFFLPHSSTQNLLMPVPSWFACSWILLGLISTLLYIRTVNLLFKLVSRA